jgi:hypothetical protein
LEAAAGFPRGISAERRSGRQRSTRINPPTINVGESMQAIVQVGSMDAAQHRAALQDRRDAGVRLRILLGRAHEQSSMLPRRFA